jgi:hypothetical protein
MDFNQPAHFALLTTSRTSSPSANSTRDTQGISKATGRIVSAVQITDLYPEEQMMSKKWSPKLKLSM